MRAFTGGPGRVGAVAVGGLLVLGGLVHAEARPAAAWVVAWTSPLAEALGPTAPPPFSATTVRNAVRVTAGGTAVRVRIANDDGRIPLRIGAATVGRVLLGPSLVPGSLATITFGGRRAVTVPAGRHVYSDPVRITVTAGEDLAVSLFLPSGTNPVDSGTAYTPSWSAVNGSGDATGQVTGAGLLPTMPLSTAYVGAVDVRTTEVRGAVVVLGDSIAQGALALPAAHLSWPDLLGTRLSGRLALANGGISGNDATTDQPASGYGPSGVRRLWRDVLSQSGVRTVVVALGVNDLNHACGTPEGVGCSASRVISALRTLAQRARAGGVRVVGVTVTPVRGKSGWDSPSQLAARRTVNDWIRSTSAYDAVVDFDLVIRWNGVDPERLNPLYDGGDHLHPGTLGHRAMADAFDVRDLS